MVKIKKALFVWPFFGLLLSCNILPGAQSGGACQASDGRTVNTYSIYGSWKQIQGYDPARTQTKLKIDYDILLVLRNGDTCKLEVMDGADQGVLPTVSSGTYSHDVDRSQLQVDLTSDVRSGRTSNVITYSFSGRCDGTRMTWTYDNGDTEVFEYRSKDTEGASCTTPE
jgi:hypothetical protein